MFFLCYILMSLSNLLVLSGYLASSFIILETFPFEILESIALIIHTTSLKFTFGGNSHLRSKFSLFPFITYSTIFFFKSYKLLQKVQLKLEFYDVDGLYLMQSMWYQVKHVSHSIISVLSSVPLQMQYGLYSWGGQERKE